MSEAPKINMSLDQFLEAQEYERTIANLGISANFMRATRRPQAAERFETLARHVAKHLEEHVRSCQSGLVIAQAGVIPDIKGSTH